MSDTKEIKTKYKSQSRFGNWLTLFVIPAKAGIYISIVNGFPLARE